MPQLVRGRGDGVKQDLGGSAGFYGDESPLRWTADVSRRMGGCC